MARERKRTPPAAVAPASANAESEVNAEHVPIAVQVGERGDLNRYLQRDIPAVVHKQSFLMNEWQAFLTGLMFFTRLPCPMWVDHNLYWLSQSTVYFPLLGVIVGLFGAAAAAVGTLLWHPAVGVLMSTLATVWLTGAFHEDGVADSFDAFGGGWTRAEILRIMKDSRIGTYGAVGLLLVMGTKITALSLLLVPAAGSVAAAVVWSPMVLVVGHVMGRWACVYLLYAHEYIDEAGSAAPGKQFVLSVSYARLVAGTVSAFVFTLAALGLERIRVVAGVWVVCTVATVYAGHYIESIIGGVLGDALGAANQIIELIAYLVMAMRPIDAIVADLFAALAP
ncbi:cobalamin-5-phosphate synthase-domain-containing protein [Blastocladiella britannica]|nr:cobalamin-5-phosphate synthase-domain-containing protein [Blastocladiella britannica]